MNKIYKLIWSKVKNMWVVASELAKSHTKSPNSGIVGSVSLASLESKINTDLSKGFVAGVFPMATLPAVKSSSFTITVAAIVKNEAENVPTWVQAARSCADEIVVVDTGSTDDTVKRFADYGIKCFHYDWHDDFASAKNYMISLCHGDWIVLLDGDEWFRDGCDVRKAIAKHHANPITKAIIADWICLDKDRNNAVMFSGGAVRAFRNQPNVRYFRKVHENLTINYENFAFEPEFKMYHTGYSGSVNRSKHERNLRIMRTMFDFDNGEVEFPTDWRYIEDTYAGLGQFDKALWAADKMISYGVQEYSAAAWITKFNVLFAMKTSLEEMKKQFAYCFKTVPSVSGFRFLASVYFFRNGLIAAGLDNYIEGLRMLMGPQDKVAQEYTYWRMYMPEASALASAVYLQNKQVEAALCACKVCEQYCGQTDWTNRALVDVRRIMNQSEERLLGNITERVLPVFQFGKKAVLATALASSLTIGMVGNVNPVFAACCNLNGVTTNRTTGDDSIVTGGECNTASGYASTVTGGSGNIAANFYSSVSGGSSNTTSGNYSSVSGGLCNTAGCDYSLVSGGFCNTASGYASSVIGGCFGIAYACYSTVIGGGIAGNAECSQTALGSVAIGQGAVTVRNYEVALGSSEAPVSVGGNMNVIGTNMVTDGTTTKSWSDILNAGGFSGGSISYVGVNSTGNENKDGSGASGTDAIAIGKGAVASGNQSVSIGTGNQVRGNHSGAVGDPNIVDGSDSYVVGNNSTVHANVGNVFVLGNNTTVDNGLPDNWDSMSDEEKAAWANGLASTDIMEGVVALGSNISVSLDNKAAMSRTSSGDPAIKHVVALGDNVVIGEENAVGIGHTATATALNALAIGDDAQAVAEGANAVGHSSRATNRFANAFGYQAQATGEGAGAFGQDAQATANFATAFGRSTRASAESATAIGNTAHAVTQSSIAIGSSAVANGGANTNAVAIGRGAAVGSDTQGYGEAVALGGGSSVQNAYGTALGSGASVTGQNSVALGYGSTAAQSNVVSVGKDAVTGDTPVAEVTRRIVHVADGVNDTDVVNVKQLNDAKTKYFGVNSSDSTGQTNTNVSGAGAIGSDSIAIGKFASACGACSVAIGICSSVTDVLGVALGAYATAGDAGVAIGGDITSGTFANGASVAIGSGARAEGVTSTALNKAQALGRDAIAVGYEAYVSGDYAIGIGNAATVMYTNGIAIGYNSSASEDSISMGNLADANDQAVALGMRSYAQGIGSVALGSQSVASDDYVVSFGSDAVTTGSNQHDVINRRLVHVAAGVDDTDAVNVKQLNDQKVEYVGVNAVWKSWASLTDDEKIFYGVTTEEEYNLLKSTSANINGDGAIGDNSIAIGKNAKSLLYGTIAIGENAVASSNDSSGGIAIGTDTAAMKYGSIALGANAKSPESYGVSIGESAFSKIAGVAVGRESVADKYAIAIGEKAKGNGQTSIVIGNTVESTADADMSILLGYQSQVSGSESIVMGYHTTSVGDDNIVIGHAATSTDSASDAIAIGSTAKVSAHNGIALGHLAKSLSSDAIAVGSGAEASNGQSSAFGIQSKATGDGAVALGLTTRALKPYSTAIGTGALASGSDDGSYPGYSVAVGNQAEATGDSSTAIGTRSKAYSLYSTAVGNNASVNGEAASAFGEYTTVEGNYSSALGSYSHVYGNQSTVLGYGSNVGYGASSSFNNATAIGTYVNARGDDSTVLGYYSDTSSSNAVAIGRYAHANTQSSVVIGDTVATQGQQAVVVGYNSNVYGQDSIAIGSNVNAYAPNSVALGSNSTATQPYVLSIGKDAVGIEGQEGYVAEITRTIQHVTAGVNDTDAVNVKQLNDGLYDKANWDASNIGRNLSMADDEYPEGLTDEQKAEVLANNREYNLRSWGQALGAGTVTGGDSYLVTGDTVHVEVRPAENGTYVKTNNTTGQNLLALDQQLSTVLEGTASQNTAISDLQNEMDTKVNVGLDNITDAGKTVVRDLAKESVKVVNGTNTTVTEGTDGNAKTYAVNAVTDGAVADGNTGIVTGGTVYSAIQDMIASSGSSEGKANVALDNVTEAGHAVIKSDAKSAVNVAGTSDVTVTKTDVDGVDMYNVAVVKTGTVSDGNEGIVTGDTVYDALRAEALPSADGNYITAGNTAGANLTALDAQVKTNTNAIASVTDGMDGKANTSLDNVTSAGQDVIRTLAKGSVKVVNGTHTTVTEGTDGDAKTYVVNVSADGLIADGDTGIVTGGAVYNALQTQASDTATVLDTKANKDASNVTDAEAWGTKIATGSVSENDVKAVSGDTVYRMKTVLESAVSDGLDGKANVGLDNISTAGEGVVKDLAKGSVNVVGGVYATVDKSDVNGVDTYTVNVDTSGAVTDGDTKLVTGGVVYNALQTQASDMATALDTKANKDASNVTDAEAWGTKIATGSVAENDVRAISGDTAYRIKTALETAMNTGLDSKADNDLSNLTDAGQAVIQQKAISSVKVGDGDNTTVSSETDADGNIIYKVKANATGTVAANDTGLVDGGTVYEALENTKSEMTGNISGKADKDLGNITDDGKEVVKDLAKDSVSVESGTNAEVVKTDVNGVDTYTVNVAGNGQVSENDTGLVNGGTMYNELRPVDGNYVRKDVTTAANLSALDTKIGSVSDGTFVRSANTVGQNLNALDEALYDKANKDASNIGRNLSIADHEYPDGLTAEQKAEYASNQREYNLRSWGQALGAGTVTGGDARLITGDTFHVEVRPANSGTYVRVDKTTGENLLALDEQLSSVVNGSSAQSTAISDLENEMANKANIALDNINADGVNVVRDIAKSAVVVADGPNTTVSSSTDTDGNITYRVTANATGSVADGNTGLVDGGMVYTAIENAKGSMGGDIGGLDADGNYIRKANTVAQNLVALDTQVKTNADGLAAEQTARETADTALSNRIGTLTADGNYIAKDSSVSENLSRLDTAVKTAGDTADANAAAIADLKDLSNITVAGETVIKDLAKGSVKVINGTNTTVTEGMDGDVKTFAVNVASNGAVADGDTGLVSGGTVKSALDALSGSVDAGLAGKANVSLDNLDADGHTVIKSDAKSAVNVVGSNRATVTKADVNGVDTYTVDVKADGEILADNKGLVDGGTVFDAVVAATGNIIDYTNDGLAGKANVELDNLAATGHAVIKSDAKSAVNVTGGQYATVTKTDVDGVDTYTVNVATDGSVTDGNEKLVTGGSVYDALQGIRGSVDTAMAGKANTSLDNLDVAGVGRVRDIAKTAVSVANGAHTTASSETDADGNVTYRVNVDLDGSVASGNNGVVSGGGIYNELRPADGNYVAQSNTTAANLTALDVAVKEAMTKAETAQAVAGGNVVLYDGDDKSAVTLGGIDGTVIHNVADGAVSADSKDAVNGGQLYTVKSSVDANTTAIAGLDTKIQDHATAIAGLDTRVQDNATAIAGLDTRVQDNATAIAGLDTRVQDNATAIDTLRTTVTDGLNGKVDTDLGNLSDTGKEMVRGLAKESVRVADGLNTTVRTTVDGNASVYHVDVATTGRVESGNAGIVTGDAVYEALRDLELNASDTHYVSVNPSERDDETYTNHGASGSDAVAIGAKSYARGDVSVAIGHNNDVSGNETYVIGSDVNATGNHSVVLGKGSDGSLDNVVSVGSAGNERRIVHVADGDLSVDSKDAVNGKQLYEVREKLQNAEGIDVDKWSDALGTGSVAPDDDRLVKGSTVYSAIQSFSGITLSPDGSTLHVGTNNTAMVVDFSNSEGNGRVLQGVVTDPDNPNSAANVGYVNAVGQNIIHGVNNSLNRMDTRIDKVGAGAAALASLEPMPFDDDQKWSISAAIGTYHGTQAGAVGVFYKPQDNVMLNIRGAVGNGENMGGAGLSIGLNKGAAKGLSKASMAKAMNAQANEIVAQKQLIQNQQAQLDAQKAEIEELKQMVRSVVASKQVTK